MAQRTGQIGLYQINVRIPSPLPPIVLCAEPRQVPLTGAVAINRTPTTLAASSRDAMTPQLLLSCFLEVRSLTADKKATGHRLFGFSFNGTKAL
jgi:hypothetical protein